MRGTEANAAVGATPSASARLKRGFLVTQPVKAYCLDYYKICQMGSA